MGDNEPLEAHGDIMTRITCPACDDTFDLEGDCDADRVECPACEAPLVVRRSV